MSRQRGIVPFAFVMTFLEAFETSRQILDSNLNMIYQAKKGDSVGAENPLNQTVAIKFVEAFNILRQPFDQMGFFFLS